MKKLLYTLLFCLFTTITYATKPPYNVGESYTYKINYGIINAGYAELNVKGLKKGVYKLEGKGRTNIFFDNFFRVRDTYISYYDYREKKPVRFIRDVNEGGYIIKQNYVFDTEKK